MRHDRDAAGLVDPGERVRQRAEHRYLVFDPKREEMARSRRYLDTCHDLDRARAPRRKLAQLEGAADVVVIGERDDVQSGLLGGGEDLFDRRKTVAQVAVKLQIRSTHFA